MSAALLRRGRGVASALLLVALAAAGCADRPRGIDSRVDHRPDAGGRIVSYTVGPDDTWNSIAESFFGDRRNAARIATDNGADPAVAPPAGETVEVRILEEEMPAVRSIAEARGSYNAGVELLDREGGAQQAREAFERALDRAPHFVDARYNLALALMRQDEYDRARRELENVVAARPDDKDALYALAASHFHVGDYAGALPGLERALRLDPDFLRARFTLALSLERLGRTRDAARAWEQYLQRDSSSAWAEQARQHLRELGS